MQTHREIENYLREFFEDQSKYEDSPDNRAILSEQIRNEYDGIFNNATLAGAADDRSDDLKIAPPVPKKQRQAVYSDPANTRAVLAQINAEMPWFNPGSEKNLEMIFHWLWEENVAGGFTVENVRTCVKVLGSVMERILPPPAASVPVVVTAPRFNWDSVLGQADVPLTAPDGTAPPSWFLNKLSREQIRSFVRRDAEAKKPKATALPEGELGLDATQEQMQAASPAQLARLIQRQRQARYGV